MEHLSFRNSQQSKSNKPGHTVLGTPSPTRSMDFHWVRLPKNTLPRSVWPGTHMGKWQLSQGQVAEGAYAEESQLSTSRKPGLQRSSVQLVERKVADLSFSLMVSCRNSGFR